MALFCRNPKETGGLCGNVAEFLIQWTMDGNICVSRNAMCKKCAKVAFDYMKKHESNPNPVICGLNEWPDVEPREIPDFGEDISDDLVIVRRFS